MHLHLRQEALLKAVAPISSVYCSDVLVMPNTDPAIVNGSDILAYQKECEVGCFPLMTAKLTPATTPEIVESIVATEGIALKGYPEGVTTGSEGGLTREMLMDFPPTLVDSLKAMEHYDLMSLWHGELPGSFSMDREEHFLPVLQKIADLCPHLRIVLEHISTAAGVNVVRKLRKSGVRISGTITSHHPWFPNGLDDLLGGKLYTDRFCKPILKRPEDAEALREVIFNAEEGFCWGSDSAAHEPEKKHAAECCAGCFTAGDPEMLVQLFEEHGALKNLEKFVVHNATSIYGLSEPSGCLTFVKEPRTVPDNYNGITPLLAGETLNWTLKEASA